MILNLSSNNIAPFLFVRNNATKNLMKSSTLMQLNKFVQPDEAAVGFAKGLRARI